MRAIAVFLIVLYQRYISPYKGFRCAHAVRHGGPSCSAAVRGIVESEGLWRGWPLIRRRFAECRLAAQQQRPETEEERRERERQRRRRRREQGNCGCAETRGPCEGPDCTDCVVLDCQMLECSGLDCSALDCGGADCAPADCSLSLFRPRGGRSAQSAQGS